MYETIIQDCKNGVLYVTMNRPESLNAFTEQLNKEITDAIRKASKDSTVRCVVISGEGRAFCSGEDLGSVSTDLDHGEVLRKRYIPMIKAIANCEKPIIAAVNGVAAGAGMSLALACDFRIASEKASFIEAFVHVGLVPDSGNLFYLPRIVGHAKALELAILGEKISAEAAKDIGLVTKVFPVDSLLLEVESFAERLANMPTKAIGLIKRTIQNSWDSSLDEFLEKEAQAQRIAGLTEDHQEGVRSFFQKQKPTFIGK